MQVDRLKNRRYLNWVRTSLSLLYLKQGLENISDEQAGELHRDVKNKVLIRDPWAITSKCTQCTDKNVKKARTPDKKSKTWSFNCQTNICNVWLDEILPYHVHQPLPNVAWANSDPRAWPSDPWAVAKLFQPFGCEGQTKAEDSDCAGLLSMMKDCRFFHTFLPNTTLLQEIKDVRNACMHSGDLEISDADMTKGLNLMISLLEEPVLNIRQECIEAKEKIEQLRDNELDLALNKELELQALNSRITGVQHDMNTLAAEQKALQTSLADVSHRQDGTQEECRKVNERIQTLSQQMTEVTQSLDGLKQMHDPTIETKLTDLTSQLRELTNNTQLFQSKVEARLSFLEAASRNDEQRRRNKNIAHIQKTILDLYEKHCQKIPIYPLRPSRKTEIDDLYVWPSIVVEDPRGIKRQDTQGDEVTAERVKDIFYSGNKLCKDIYISGEMGHGKTSLCEHLLSLWFKYHRGPRPLTEDQASMGEFTFLFHISLREANREFRENYRIETIIQAQLQLSDYNVKELMSDNRCLILLDGLDELTQTHGPGGTRFESQNLPQRIHSDTCVYITTSRPFKLELLAPELEGHIGRQLNIKGLDQHLQTELANNVVTLLNVEYSKDKSAEQFISDMKHQNLTKYLETPVLFMFMIGLWFDDKPIGSSQCEIYSNMIEKQIEFSAKVRGIYKDEHSIEGCQDQLPSCFVNTPYCQKYKALLFKVSKLAFERLFDKNQKNSLIFDHDQIEICGLSDGEVQQLLHMGILTQHKVFGGITEELKSVTFLHKSHQEFFCALYLSTKCKRTEMSRILSEVICYLYQALNLLDNIFIFVCGMNEDIAAAMRIFITLKECSDEQVNEYLYSNEPIYDCYELMEDIQYFIVMGAEEARKNHKSVAALTLHDIFVRGPDDNYDELLYACNTSNVISISFHSKNVKTWPLIPQAKKIFITSSIIDECDVFTSNFSSSQLSTLNLYDMDMTHAQLDHLFESLSSSKNLEDVWIETIHCLTHEITDEECITQVNFSRHLRLRRLYMWQIYVNEISCLRLSQKMENLEIIRLETIVVSSAGFRQAMETLPKNGVNVKLGNGCYTTNLRVKGAMEATDVLNQIRQFNNEVDAERVEYSNNVCEILNYEFWNTYGLGNDDDNIDDDEEEEEDDDDDDDDDDDQTF